MKSDPYLSLRALLLNQPINLSLQADSQPINPSTRLPTDVHAKHRRELIALFLDQQTEEQRRIEASKNFLLDYLGGINQLIDQLKQQVNQSMIAVNRIDAKQDLNLFLAAKQLTLTDEELEQHLAHINAMANPQPVNESTDQSTNSSNEAATEATDQSITQSNDESVAVDEPAQSEATTDQSTTDQPITDQSTTQSTTASSTDASTTDQSTNESLETPRKLSSQPSRKSSSVAPTSAASLGSQSTEVPSVFHLHPPSPDPSFWTRVTQLEVAKEGILTRPGRFFKANWKPQSVVLTRSGFLHCFEEGDTLQPSFSLSLADCVAQTPTNAPLIVEVVHSYTPVFGKKETQTINPFKALSAQDAQDWCKAINDQCYVSGTQ